MGYDMHMLYERERERDERERRERERREREKVNDTDLSSYMSQLHASKN